MSVENKVEVHLVAVTTEQRLAFRSHVASISATKPVLGNSESEYYQLLGALQSIDAGLTDESLPA